MKNPVDIVFLVVALLMAAVLHELAHALVADRLGDSTARRLGRITLSPLAHIDPFGSVVLPLLLVATNAPILFGWAKPVPINPFNFRRPARDMAITAAAGPISNFCLAFLSILCLSVLIVMKQRGVLPLVTEPMIVFFGSFLVVNLVLGLFNLIPIPPLDGGRILVGILPPGPAGTLRQIEPYGMFLLILLIMIDRNAGIFDRAFGHLTEASLHLVGMIVATIG